MGISNRARWLLVAGAVAGLMVAPVQAQQAPMGMSQQDMDRMMQQVKQLQTCMSSLGPELMQRIQERGRTAEAEIRGLCEAGQRDEAMQAALRYGRSLSESKDMQALQQCGHQALAMARSGPLAKLLGPGLADKKEGHICDAY